LVLRDGYWKVLPPPKPPLEMIISDIEQALSHKQEAIDRLANGETLVDVARTFGVDPTTIGRLQQ
jgi:hypothetical protein